MNTAPPIHSELTAEGLEPIRADLMHEGVAVVPALVPRELCADARAAIDDWRAEHGPTDGPAQMDGGRVPVNQHPALWAVRQHPPVYELFRSLLGTPFLWVTVDEGLHDRAGSRCCEDLDCRIGWRIDPREAGHHLRGMILLSDARTDPGAFRCIPHIYRNPQPWWSIHGVEPIDSERIREDQVVSVMGDVGSLILWDARLPSGRGENATTEDRYGMHLAMDREGDDARRRERVRNFEEGLPPAWDRSLPGQPAPGSFGQARLTDLGACLLGRDAW